MVRRNDMYWIDAFGDRFAVWFCGEIVEICKTRTDAEILITKLLEE